MSDSASSLENESNDSYDNTTCNSESSSKFYSSSCDDSDTKENMTSESSSDDESTGGMNVHSQKSNIPSIKLSLTTDSDADPSSADEQKASKEKKGASEQPPPTEPYSTTIGCTLENDYTMTMTLINSHKEVIQGAPDNTKPTETAHHVRLQRRHKELDPEVAIEAK